MYKVKTNFGEYDVEIRMGNYVNGGLAIELVEPREGPFARLTVNLGRVNHGYAYVDTNNCPWAEEFIRENELGEFANKTCVSGYCEYPLYKFYVDRIGGE